MAAVREKGRTYELAFSSTTPGPGYPSRCTRLSGTCTSEPAAMGGLSSCACLSRCSQVVDPSNIFCIYLFSSLRDSRYWDWLRQSITLQGHWVSVSTEHIVAAPNLLSTLSERMRVV